MVHFNWGMIVMAFAFSTFFAAVHIAELNRISNSKIMFYMTRIMTVFGLTPMVFIQKSAAEDPDFSPNQALFLMCNMFFVTILVKALVDPGMTFMVSYATLLIVMLAGSALFSPNILVWYMGGCILIMYFLELFTR